MGLGAEDREERETAEPWNRAAHLAGPNHLRPGLRTAYAEGGRTSQGLEHCPSRFFGEFVPGPANKRFSRHRSYPFLGLTDAIWLP